MFMFTSVGAPVPFLLITCPRVELPCESVCVCSASVRSCQFSKRYQPSIPSAVYAGSSRLHIFPYIFYILFILVGIQWYLIVTLFYISVMTIKVENPRLLRSNLAALWGTCSLFLSISPPSCLWTSSWSVEIPYVFLTGNLLNCDLIILVS